MDNYPQTHFVTNQETEANRVLHTMVQTANGFYFTHKFAVLPYLIPNNPSAVHLPDLDFNKVKPLWEDLKSITETIPLNYPANQVKPIEKLLPPLPEELQANIQNFEKDWQKIEQNFWKFLIKIMPTYVSNISDIEVRVTQYGSKVSFDRVLATEKRRLHCYIRQDMSIANIGEAIIQGLLYAESENNKLSWEAKESIADFLIQKLVEKNIFQEFKPTLAPLEEQPESLLKKSTQYLAKLGFCFEKPFKMENNLIYLNNNVISAKLTSIQHIILTLMIDKENQVVSYDELGDIIWTQEDDFSVWAINKNLQRLRTKLVSLGASPECIQPVKGKGYCLNNL